MPMKFRVSSEYGALEEVRNGRGHNGIDLAMPKGTELHSINSGIVERVVDHGSESIGKGVLIRTDNGDIQIYGHLDKVTVHSGERVSTGDLIGMSGNTGHSSGPHLHFGLKRDGQFADPTSLVKDLQQFSGSTPNRPGLFDFKGSAFWMFDSAQEQARQTIRDNVMDWLQVTAGIVVDLSYCIALIGCGALIILGALGLQNGYRWSGVLFGSYSVIRLLLGGAVR